MLHTTLCLLFLTAALSSFACTVFFTRRSIPYLQRLKCGQTILEIGPSWHKSKQGTPTMGGVAFLLSSFVIFGIFGIYGAMSFGYPHWNWLLATVCFFYFNGAIGFLDDYLKVVRKQNQGLRASQKFLLQSLTAIAYLFAMSAMGNFSSRFPIPFLHTTVDLGFFSYILAFFLITGFINSVNLTDGIDGLAASVTLIVSAFFLIAAVLYGNASLVLVASVFLGACVGFLVFNLHPASIFMGDTGSLFLGAAVVGMAFLLQNPLILLPVGIVYLLEAVSVILQVFCFKLFHRRIFKMAPLHHHFERCGWREQKIVCVACILTAIFAWIGLLGL